MKNRIWILALVSVGLIGCVSDVPVTTTTVTREYTTTTGPVGTDVVVAEAPPAVRVETQAVAPGPNYVWTNGYWRWTGVDYAWVPGTWVVRPRPTAVWVQGHWVRRSGGWAWISGYWR